MKHDYLLSAGCIALTALAGCTTQPPEKPNIIIIYADDLGPGDLGCYGATAVRTPYSDRLAKEGFMFSNAYACSSTCTPSRYGLLTGEYPWRQKNTGIARGDAPMIIRKDQYNVARMLTNAGYSTAVVGKWHLGLGEGDFNSQNWNGEITPGPRELGFSYSFLIPATGDRVPCVYIENQRIVNLDPNDPIEISYTTPFEGVSLGRDQLAGLKLQPSVGHDLAIVNGISRMGYMRGGKSAWWTDETMADTITQKATQFIERNRNKPFFLYFATHDIHAPRVPHVRFVGKTSMGARGDAIVEFDWSVGQILTTLDRLNLTDNTLIILSSDNGPVVEEGYRDHGHELIGSHKPAGILRGGKYSALEGGTRVPFIIRWPAQVKPGTSRALISQIDLVGSLAQLCGQNNAALVVPDNHNSLDTWLGKSYCDREYVVEQSIGTRSIISDNWKYITPCNAAKYYEEGKIELGHDTIPQLYNIMEDVQEKANMATKYPDKVLQLKSLLDSVKSKEKLNGRMQ
jgi:arylsulfatase A-like enzyme